ncbi:MAG: PAS domain-containing sensor histidine kinase [Gammaproteobacteria bacterium]|nr:PAS domain-containing sensor histidine kinase [Gammaproteobacteria bacterium]
MTAETLNQKILENLNTATLLFNDELKLEHINPAGEMLLAISYRQLKQGYGNDYFEQTNVLMEALVTTKKRANSLTQRELEVALPNLSQITVDCTVTPFIAPDLGQVYLMELQQIDRRLQIIREKNLLSQHDTTHAVVRGLAHEINNPLGGIKGAAQLLERELPHHSLKEYTQVITSEIDRLQTLVGRLLGPYTRPLRRPTNIHKLIEHVRTLVNAETPDTLQFKRDYDPSLPEIQLDPDQIIQTLLNIVRNATQAVSHNGQITLQTRAKRQITIGSTRHRLVLCISIIDNGPGIPDDMKEKIFFPMVTTRAEGTGLGLSIAQSIINQHSGLIECHSLPGHTEFKILLPMDMSHE